jgi:hypothetical protein
MKRNPKFAGSVHLHIERLVLDGFSLNGAEAARLRMSVERECERMLAGTRAESWNGGVTRLVEAAPVHLAPVSSPAVWGRQIARTLFGSLSPQTPAAAPLKAAVQQPRQTKF